jgi:hypothetical protein
MSSPNRSHAEPVTIITGQGKATFRRESPSDIVIDIEYDIPPLEAVLAGASLETGVAAACHYEIGLMRAALGQLGEHLASRLDDRGRSIEFTRQVRERDRRTWHDLGNELHIDASHTRVTDRLHGYEGVSEAGLVREHVRLVIEQREESIRKVYKQVLTDISACRGSRKA